MARRDDSNVLRITRIYDAPVKAVWDAWIDPAQLAQWWGPRGFTHTTHRKDLRPGGTWRYTMHGPDGVDYPNIATYHEVEEHRRLVYDHGATDETPPLFRVRVLFSEEDGRTRMDMTMTLATAQAADETRRFIKKAGGNATWDRLGEFLAQREAGRPIFLIHRTFEAPMGLMYELWTDPRHFSQWLPPTGMKMRLLRSDIREGGSALYVLEGGGVSLYGRTRYLEMKRPHRVVYTQQFCDENEKVARHPMAPVWPETMLTTVTLTEEGEAQTRVRVQWEPQGTVSREELEAFLKERGGMTLGWTGSFDKLEERIEAVGLQAGGGTAQVS